MYPGSRERKAAHIFIMPGCKNIGESSKRVDQLAPKDYILIREEMLSLHRCFGTNFILTLLFKLQPSFIF